MLTADALLRFLKSTGKPAEADFYLRRFRDQPAESFAAVAFDAAVAAEAEDAVALDLRLLHGLGLRPRIVGRLLDDGSEVPARLVEAIAHAGVPLAPASSDPEHVRQVTGGGQLALVTPSANGAWTGDLGALLAALGVHKVVVLRQAGGLTRGGRLVADVNVTDERHALRPELTPLDARLLDTAVQLVNGRRDRVVHVATPLNLLRELFTVKGAGTLIRTGAAIGLHDGYSGVDHARLEALLERAFGRAVNPGFFDRPADRIYLDTEYRGAAIVEGTPIGRYLTKFAVDRAARGEGVGRDLWNRMMSDNTTLFWRARPDNPINEAYLKRCTGLHRTPDWTVFWVGLAAERVADAVRWALAAPVDLLTSPAADSPKSGGA